MSAFLGESVEYSSVSHRCNVNKPHCTLLQISKYVHFGYDVNFKRMCFKHL
jgi:hypothetical protein